MCHPVVSDQGACRSQFHPRTYLFSLALLDNLLDLMTVVGVPGPDAGNDNRGTTGFRGLMLEALPGSCLAAVAVCRGESSSERTSLTPDIMMGCD